MKTARNITSVVIVLLFCLLGIDVYSQKLVYNSPTHYSGLTWDHPMSAQSTALGRHSVTLSGIRTAFENPSNISSEISKYSFATNYVIGHPWRLKSHYLFLGGHYKLFDKLAIGISSHGHTQYNPLFSTQIATVNFWPDKRTQRAYSLILAGELFNGFHFGVSGNQLVEHGLDNTKTSSDFVISTGITYDKVLELVKNEKVTNQKIRLAASLFNTTFKDTLVQRANDSVWQYRDLPIIFRTGFSYGFSLPFKPIFNCKKLDNWPHTLDLSIYLQYDDWLKAMNHIYTSDQYNTTFSLGIEATFYTLIAIRLGYFRQSTTIFDEPGEKQVTKDRRRGITYGAGFQLPVKNWFGDTFPLDVKFDLVAKRHPDYLREELSVFTHKKMTDNKLMFSFGLVISGL